MKQRPRSTKQTGNDAEKGAKEWLLSQGHEIIYVNWRFRRFEIDIIATTSLYRGKIAYELRSS